MPVLFRDSSRRAYNLSVYGCVQCVHQSKQWYYWPLLWLF